MAVATKQKSALTRKLGPLPTWAWAALTGGAIYLYRSRSSSSGASSAPDPNAASYPPSSVNPDTGLPWNINPDTGQPYGSTPGAGDTTTPDPGGTGTPSTGTGTGGHIPGSGLKFPKPRAKITRPRKHKAKGPHHGKKGHPPIHHKRKRKPKRGGGAGPARTLSRTIPTEGGLRSRFVTKKAAHTAPHAAAPASAASSGRSSSSHGGRGGGRTNAGGEEHAPQTHRPAAPAAGGQRVYGRTPARPQGPAAARGPHEEHRAQQAQHRKKR